MPLSRAAMLAPTANVVAHDVVLGSPPFDHADRTVDNAHPGVLEMLADIAYKRLQRPVRHE